VGGGVSGFQNAAPISCVTRGITGVPGYGGGVSSLLCLDGVDVLEESAVAVSFDLQPTIRHATRKTAITRKNMKRRNNIAKNMLGECLVRTAEQFHSSR